MKGFVNVRKDNLRKMAIASKEVVNTRYEEGIKVWLNYFEKVEEKRCSKKRFLIFSQPKPRFTHVADIPGFAKEEAKLDWEMDPFTSLKDKRDEKISWLNEFISIANSYNSEEPITIKTEDFLMLNDPNSYYWVNIRYNWKATWE
jgi:hypothetical protein